MKSIDPSDADKLKQLIEECNDKDVLKQMIAEWKWIKEEMQDTQPEELQSLI